MTNWTNEQLEAINKDGTNIIVSAGAGSGKTAVLTERVIRKLRDGVNIDHLLVLTFTNAAATEMKDRIRTAIKKEGMNDQLDYIDSAYITTFDSFAQSIVKKYHYLLNISSKINIVDNTIIEIAKKKFIDEIFESQYGQKEFDNFISNYCEKDDELLKKSILSINDKLDLKYDKNKYLDSYIEEYYCDIYINDRIKEYDRLVTSMHEDIKETLYNIQILADGTFYNKLYEMLLPLIDSNSYNEIRNNITVDKYPINRNSIQELKDEYAKLKAQISNLKDMCKYSLEELKDNYKLTISNTKVIIDIIKKLDNAMCKYKSDNEIYTFNDIAKLAIEIVDNNKSVQNELKKFYNEIMVDEYQDTSDLQEKFISLISNNNVYMVGDIKQSIYRFRHANPEIFRKKYNDYSKNINGYKIDLLKNFRSREEVLNNINEIFDLIMDDKIGNAEYQESHRMVFGNHMYDEKNNNQEYNLSLLNYSITDDYKKYSKEEIEAFIIGNDINKKIKNKYQILDKETKKLRDMNYGDVCIIMDRGSAFETYSKVFEYLSIPIVIWKDEVLSNEADIAIIKNIINLIIKIKNNCYDQKFKYYFMSVARSYLFSYSDSNIFDMLCNNKYQDTELYKVSKTISEKLDAISNGDLLDLIINEYHIYKKMITVGDCEKGEIRINNLSSLFNSLSELGYTPYDLSDYFNDISNTEIKYSLNTKIPGSVNLMNIHKSKGLEFSICYFSGFSKQFNDSDVKDNFIYDDKYGIIIPFYNNGIGNTFLKDLFKNKYVLDDISERIRLLYVGVTRAKEKMIMVAPLNDTDASLTSSIIPDSIRMKYKSFLDIINSVKSKLEPYIIDISLDNCNLTKDYNLIFKNNYHDLMKPSNKKIKYIDNNICSNLMDTSHYSKVTNELRNIDEINSMDIGTYVHYLLEVTDFNNPIVDGKYKDKILKFISKLDLKNVYIYKEYEFIYKDNDDIKHGVIDLMLEYNDHVDIIDYKLKNIIDDKYINQISGYKRYIELKTCKKVNTFLYSIFDEEFKEIK